MSEEPLRGFPLALLVLVSFAVGVLLRLGNYPVYYGYFVVAALLAIAHFHTRLYGLFREFAEGLSTSKMLYMGRPLSPRFVSSYAVAVQAASYLFVVITAVGVVYYMAYGALPLWLPVLAIVLAAALGLAAALPGLQASLTASARKTSAEVELPFLLLVFRVLGSTHLALYDVLYAVEKSSALRAWSREVKGARRLASVLGTSLITAMNIIAENHPSETVRDVFRRIITVAVSTGTLKEVAAKAFGHVYARLEARLSGLVDKLTMINGVLILAFLFVPVVFALVVPIYGASPSTAFLMPLALYSLFFFVIYGVVSSLYPSAFAIDVPKPLLYVGTAGLAVPVLSILFAGFRVLITRDASILPLAVVVVPLAATAPAALYSELWLRKARTYDKFIKMTLDAAAISASLGENLVSVMERLAPRYGRDVERLARRVAVAQASEQLREELVKEAPSLFHAAFIEALLHSLALGARPEVIKELASSYEHLVNVQSKILSTARMQELMIIGLIAMLSFFTGFVRGVFTGYVSVLQRVGAQGAWSVNMQAYLKFDPVVYDILYCDMTLSVLLLSLVMGKMRGGSLFYGFRTALVMLALFSTGLLVSTYLAPIAILAP